jgi:raffinose/stachyose/melibiose transport system permease protein
MYALFVLQPLVLTIHYSFYKWNGVAPRLGWIEEHVTIFQVPA